MFERITLENADGDVLNFSIWGPFTITEITGLDPPPATINTSELALVDGARFNSSKVQPRTINLAFAIQEHAAARRIDVFRVLKSKQWIRLRYVGEYRDVYIDGYVQDINISYWAKKQIVTVAILCPQPFFQADAEAIDSLSLVVDDFHFPFESEATPEIVFGHVLSQSSVTIVNNGDVACGMIIELYAKAAVTDPTVYNYITGESLGLSYSLQAADLVTIDTRQGHKSATLLRGGTTTNLFNYVTQGSSWLQLPANGGTFVYNVGTGNATDLTVIFRHVDLFEGV